MLIGTVYVPIDCTPVEYLNGMPLGFKSVLLGYSNVVRDPNENIEGVAEI